MASVQPIIQQSSVPSGSIWPLPPLQDDDNNNNGSQRGVIRHVYPFIPGQEYPAGRRPEIKREETKPRKLTNEEILDIINSLPSLSSAVDEISANNRKYIQEMERFLLSKIKISPPGISKLKEILIRSYESSRIPLGSVVGLSAAEALGAPVTQMTLNSFHQTGTSKNVTTGIEGINEIINATPIRRAPSSTIIFKNQRITFDEILNEKRASVVDVTIDRLLMGEGYIVDSPENILSSQIPLWYEQYSLFIGDIPQSNWMTRLILSPELMYMFQVTPNQVADAIVRKNQAMLSCVYSPIITYTKEEQQTVVGRDGLETTNTITRQVPVCYIDVYPNEQTIRSGLPEEAQSVVTRENQSLIFLSTIFVQSLDKIHVKGVPKISMIYPVEVTIWQIVREEVRLSSGTGTIGIESSTNNENRWRLMFSQNRLRTTGIQPNRLNDLLRVMNVEILETTDEYVTIKVPPKTQFPDLDKVLDQDPDATTDLELSSTTTAAASQAMLREKEKRRKKLKPYITPGELFRYYQAIDEKIAKEFEKERRAEVNRLILVERNPAAAMRVVTRKPQSDFGKAATFVYADTDGTNLKALFQRDDVNPYHTYSNNMYEILFLLGIEAARTFIVRELIFTLTSSGGDYINPRHIILLIDFMTYGGSIRKVMLSGIKAQPTGVLSHASFEQAMKGFTEAAAFGAKEPIVSTSASVFTGIRIKGGTGYTEVIIDEKRQRELEEEARRERPKQIDPTIMAAAISGLNEGSFGAGNVNSTLFSSATMDAESELLSMVGTIQPLNNPAGPLPAPPSNLLPSILLAPLPPVVPLGVPVTLTNGNISGKPVVQTINNPIINVNINANFVPSNLEPLIRPKQVVPEKLQEVANELKEAPCLPTTGFSSFTIKPLLSGIPSVPLNTQTQVQAQPQQPTQQPILNIPRTQGPSMIQIPSIAQVQQPRPTLAPLGVPRFNIPMMPSTIVQQSQQQQPQSQQPLQTQQLREPIITIPKLLSGEERSIATLLANNNIKQ